jgi:hypothetical protein
MSGPFARERLQRVGRRMLLHELTVLAIEAGQEPNTGRSAYASVPQLVLEAGQWFELAPDQPTGAPAQFCFANCTQAAFSLEMDYIEGYVLASDGLLHHAWLSAGPRYDRACLDPTIPWPHTDSAIMRGVRVPPAVLRQHWRNCGGASFLADQYHDYPALHVPYGRWQTDLLRALEAIHQQHCEVELAAGRALRRPDGSIWHAEHLA